VAKLLSDTAFSASLPKKGYDNRLQQYHDRRWQIDLVDDHAFLFGFKMCRRQEQCRHSILVDRHKILPTQMNSVITNEDKERVVKISGAARITNEFADRIIPIKNY
jgi:hypothetical protein